MIHQGAIVKDSLITDGCVIMPGARIEKSILSPGVDTSLKEKTDSGTTGSHTVCMGAPSISANRARKIP